MTDSKFLREVIDENRWSITALSEKLGISRQSFYKKMNGDAEFLASEIVHLSKILGLTTAQRNRIFLCDKK